MKIIIVDDNEDVRYILKKILAAENHQVHEAPNGRVALDLARNQPPDLIISDILMPEMDGFQFCREIRKDEALKNTPFVFYTATYTDAKDEQLALELGADRFIRKPMDGETFLKEIQNVAHHTTTGEIQASEPVIDEETKYLKRYNERLIQKLEKKILLLEKETASRRRAEEEWRAMFQAIGQMVFILDPRHGILEANDIVFEKLGLSKKQIIGKRCYELIHGTSQPPDNCPMVETLKTKQKVSSHLKIIKLEGDYLVTCTPVLNRDGEVEKTIHILTDISDIIKTEKKLIEGREQLRLATEAAHLGMWDYNPTTLGDTHFTDNWFTMLGYETDELPHTADTWKNLLHPDDHAQTFKLLNAHLEGKGPYRTNFRLRGKDGSYHWIHSAGSVVEWDDEGKPKRMTGVHLDVTEQKLAENKIRESEKRFATIFLANPAPIAITRLSDGRLVDVNDAWQKTTGYSKEEAVGRTAIDLNLWINPERRIKLSEDLKKSGKVRLEMQLRHRSGKTRDLLFAAESIRLEDETYMLSMALDITEQKRSESQQKEMQARLNQLQKMESIGNLAGGIAHDFNNILAAIIGFTELALDGVEKETNLEDNLQEIYSASKRAKDLVKQILAFARQSDEKRTPLQLKDTVREVVKFIRSTIPVSIEIRQNIQSDSRIMANATQIHQVLMNLCTNAAHAMEESGGVMKLSLKDVTVNSETFSIGLKQGNYVEIKVSDTGIGIDPKTIESIFDPYFTTKSPGQGTGMGLAVAHGIIESYGGYISVDSQLGKGSTFTIYLPTTGIRTTPRVDLTEHLPSGTERILFVDDELPIAKLASQILERLGYSVTTRTSSVEALALFQSKPDAFDLVITDMTMPNMTGDVLSSELMKIRPDMPVILCTGYSQKISDKSAAKIGIKAFTYKPIVKSELAETVRKILDETKLSAKDQL